MSILVFPFFTPLESKRIHNSDVDWIVVLRDKSEVRVYVKEQVFFFKDALSALLSFGEFSCLEGLTIDVKRAGSSTYRSATVDVYVRTKSIDCCFVDSVGNIQILCSRKETIPFDSFRIDFFGVTNNKSSLEDKLAKLKHKQ
mgnify:CR=1 FL=1